MNPLTARLAELDPEANAAHPLHPHLSQDGDNAR